MASLEWATLQFRTVLASHVALQFMDWRCPLRASHDVVGNSLMGVAPETADFKITVAGVQCITQCRGGLGRPLITEPALVPSFAG